MIPGKYIIHFHHNYTMSLHNFHVGRDMSCSDDFRFLPWLPGYTATLDNYTFHEVVRRDRGVAFAENDLRLLLEDESELVSENRVPSSQAEERTEKRWLMQVQPDRPWHLHMITSYERVNRPVGGGDHPMMQFSGAGVNIYILDGGMDIDHPVFDGRAVNFKDRTHSPYVGGEPVTDSDGHGTFIAGIAGGLRFGVAQWATLVVRIFSTTFQCPLCMPPPVDTASPLLDWSRYQP